MVGQKGVKNKTMGNKSKPRKWVNENKFFINPKSNKIKTCEKCKNCTQPCKQSFRVIVLYCPIFKRKDNKKHDK